MKIEPYYPDRKSLATIEEPYKGALMVLNMLYMKVCQDGTHLITGEVIDYYVMSCVRHITEKLTTGEYSFPSVFQWCKANTIFRINSDRMDFNNFSVNKDFKHATIFGAVYYVLTIEGKVNQQYLDYIETSFTSSVIMKSYFQPFKEAALKVVEGQDKHKEDGGKDESKRLTASQAGLFCEALLNKQGIQYTNKKSTISPIASKLFGYTQKTMERHGFSYTQEDRDTVADIFKGVASEFSTFIRKFGNKQANSDSKGTTTEVNPESWTQLKGS